MQDRLLPREFLVTFLLLGRLRWIAQPENARLIARKTASALAAGAQVLRDDDVQQMIDRSLESGIRRAPIAPIAGRLSLHPRALPGDYVIRPVPDPTLGRGRRRGSARCWVHTQRRER